MKLEKKQQGAGLKKEEWSLGKILIAIVVGLFAYLMITDGLDIARDIKSGKTPDFLVDVRDGIVDGYYGNPPRY
ncbi:hypothetical protein HQ45_01135 [Porphyromonas crevioricanis]|uniref:Uncharacterized protein n=2 Tax=Porphyromonas crevioricanis TaxID=393921 RepID=A0A0A2FR87_9PORP|nr:hypothetical protein [Porphyromonas crevioricanis]KGN90759.1 hypothetical protein HQ45_01135 [Porphyromonas crevioricanis]SJZ62671.1 hypothetical protein SAMN02745203_00379 [Porphyromonas crevioricanis]SQH72868.1 Uncharacterised protein [Porphyromonas crevioricanis]